MRIFKANFKLILAALASLMGDASSETRAKVLFLKAAFEKPGVTYAVCLMGRYSALMEPLTRKLQAVGVSVPSVKSMIASLHSVFDQDRMDFTTVASSIYDEACAVVGTEELSMPRVAGRQDLKFFVIMLKQNRLHNIINARYFFHILMV